MMFMRVQKFQNVYFSLSIYLAISNGSLIFLWEWRMEKAIKNQCNKISFPFKHLICTVIHGITNTHSKSTFYKSKDTQDYRGEVNFLKYSHSGPWFPHL